MRGHLLIILSFLIIPVILFSCEDPEKPSGKDKPDIPVPEVLANRGLLILNEGNFMYGNASLTWYNIVTGKTEGNVFQRQNDIPLGDVAQSANIYKGELFIVLNNSGKVIVVNFGKYPDSFAFEFTRKVTGLTSPRYISFIDSSKAYISDLYARSISVIDPESLSLIKTINLNNGNPDFYQHPTEQLIRFKNFVFTNCYSFDDKVLVIDTETDQLTDSISVLRQPNSMVLDRFGKLWVLCDGGYDGSVYEKSQAGLLRIDAETRVVEKIFILEEGTWPMELSINGGADTLYFINRDVWRMPALSDRLPEYPLITALTDSGNRLFYGLGIDPYSSEIYVSDAVDHIQNGVVYRYNPAGVVMDTIPAGIIPGFMLFF